MAKATKRFGGAAPGEFASARIRIGTTDRVGDIGPMFETARTKLRNIIDQERVARTIWHDVEVLGWMRIGAAEGSVGRRPLWTVSANIVIRHGALPYQEIDHLLADAWKAPGQTRVTPFDTASPVTKSLEKSIQDALSAWHPRADGDAVWPSDRITDLYEYVEGWSRSFQSLRIHVGLRDAKLTRHSPSAHVEDADTWIEPMPVVVGHDFSTFGHPWG